MINKTGAFVLVAIFAVSIFAFAEKKNSVPVWIDPVKAAAEHPGFSKQGEYTGERDGKKIGVQVAAMKDDQFLVLTYQGGLPGAGWDGGDLVSATVPGAELGAVIDGLEKQARTSPTMGEKAPEGARVIFDGEATSHIKGEIKDGLLWAGSSTTTPARDFKLHLEFRLPYKPDREPSNQDRGNSGVYIFNNYECQVLDSFGLDFNKANNSIPLKSDNTQWCASFYKFKTPDVPMAFPPLTWQTYDIEFTAPRFEGDEKTANARITVRHNGVLVHDDVEMPKGTGAGGKRPEKPEGIINFQGHGNPTAFRNIWLLEK